MRCRSLLAFLLAPWLLAGSISGLAGAADAARTAPILAKRAESASKSAAVTVGRRGRSSRIRLPVGPAYIYQDYPYYYSRGHYPRHIGGYVYYPAHFVSHWHVRRHKSRCFDVRRRCVADWRYRRGRASLRRW